MANEKRLIDANALKAEFPVIGNFKDDLWHSATVRVAIDNAPTVDAVEVVHGSWLKRGQIYKCSLCACCVGGHWDYCPNCGAKMDGERKEDGKE